MHLRILFIVITLILSGCAAPNMRINSYVRYKTPIMPKDSIYFTINKAPSQLTQAIHKNVKQILENEGFTFTDNRETAQYILEFKSDDSVDREYFFSTPYYYTSTFGNIYYKKRGSYHGKRHVRKNQMYMSFTLNKILADKKSPHNLMTLWHGYLQTDQTFIDISLEDIVQKLIKYYGKKKRIFITYKPEAPDNNQNK